MGRIQEEARQITLYDIEVAPEADKALLSIGRENQRLIIHAIEQLDADPRPENSILLRKGDNLRRLKIGDYRVIYGIDEISRKVTIELVRHRSVVYTLLEALKIAVNAKGVKYSG